MRRSPGVVAGAGYSSPDTVRVSTRRTFVSSTMCRFLYANDAIAPAVYSPTPGSAHRSSYVSGTTPSKSSSIAVAAACNRCARRGYPRRPQARTASPAGSAASAAGVGHRRSQASYTGSTRATGVC